MLWLWLKAIGLSTPIHLDIPVGLTVVTPVYFVIALVPPHGSMRQHDGWSVNDEPFPRKDQAAYDAACRGCERVV